MFVGTNSRDPRLSFEVLNYDELRKMAFDGVRYFGPDEWSFSGNGVEYDPVNDLGLPPEMFDDGFVPKYANEIEAADANRTYSAPAVSRL
jgi:hypothetical protein